MFARLVWQSFSRQRRRRLLAGVAVTLGMAVVTAMLAVATTVGDRISRELRSYGANLILYPEQDTLDVNLGGVDLKPASAGSFLRESDLPAIKGIFWRNNIVGFAPMLPIQVNTEHGGRSRQVQLLGTYFAKRVSFGGESFAEGVTKTHPWWKVEGAWPGDDSAGALVGEQLARELGISPGDRLQAQGRNLLVTGILTTGAAEDQQIIVPLAIAQAMIGRPGAVRRVYVSALTKPEDAFARRDPTSLTPSDRDRWYCTPYANSIAWQLTEAIPHSRAEQIRQVAQNEGPILDRITGLMLLLALAGLIAAALAVSASMASAVLERKREIGLMKSLGASSGAIAGLFMAEAALLALIAGGIGYLAGIAMARRLGMAVFGSQMAAAPVLLPIVLGISALVTFAGSAAPVRRAMRFEPGIVLRGDA